MKTAFWLLAGAVFVFSISFATAQQGLKGEYFTGQNFDRLVVARTDRQIKFDWELGEAPAPGINPDNYSVRWSGQLQAPESGQFKFSAIVDDGLRVWLDGKMVIDAWGLHDSEPVSGKIWLEAGRLYDLKVEYFNGLREGEITLLWRLPSTEDSFWSDGMKPVPSAYFFQKPAPAPIAQPVKKVEPAPKKLPKKKPAPAAKPAAKPVLKPIAERPKPAAEPAAEKPVRVDSLEKFIPKNVQFVRSRSTILPESYTELNNLVAMLLRHPELHLTIEGHTDKVGDPALNMGLSKQRAQTVAAYLVKHGIAAERLRAFGYGDTRPLHETSSPANRRVAFILRTR